MERLIRSNAMLLLWLLVFGYSFVLMGEITWRYRYFDLEANFLLIKQTEISTHSWYKYAFYVHVCSAILTLLAGFTQFNISLLRHSPVWHRRLGYVYVIGVVFFAAPSGILIGLHANGGIWAQVAFVILGILWLLFTVLAFWTATKRNLKAHQKYMYRSFALTCSALTLRYWKVVLVYFFAPNPMDLYQVIAWLGWIPNLIVVEFILVWKFRELKDVSTI
ncbi:DUF2306 domain-containing protein [Sphingobacterium sp. SYP-B4668]|uniref:DUF2306 domain-containing protein n=1 Tax=Sphingobacterium sp. SYP-B4668 TaxID=2996035 RepID=UPI0022DE4450|nr:DUF2306 domain-containing protein [Sphingobacterium sp. SYP-B4668]